MPDNEIISEEQAMPETAKEKFERERLSRRQALKRLGMTSAMAAFALFSVDDLARVVGNAMQQRAGDNKIAGQVAKEFQQSGVAYAGWLCGPSGLPPTAGEIGIACKGHPNTYGAAATCDDCCVKGCTQNYPSGTSEGQCAAVAQNKC